MKLLIFAGAGTSVELGVPAMAGMASEFQLHCKQWNVQPELVKSLMLEELDIEHLIENLDRICDARQPLQTLTDISTELNAADTIRAEVEWFVQHMAERVTRLDADLMWGAIFSSSEHHNITFVTTNYDRSIELAANASGVLLADGFEVFSGNEIATWTGFSISKHPTLIKLHGSTDWYADATSKAPVKLRHPMPLFGRGSLSLSSGEVLGSALILPSREKLLSKPPYPRLSQAFLNSCDECEAAVFVGSSLRDIHIYDAAENIAKSRPVYIVNPTEDSTPIANAHLIQEPSSYFLMSTLPFALAQPNPIDTLDSHVNSDQYADSNVIALMRRASDRTEETHQRCTAIDSLDNISVKLCEKLLRPLLNDTDPIIAKYALGLVATSPDKSSLIDIADSTPHVSVNDFAEELDLLKNL